MNATLSLEQRETGRVVVWYVPKRFGFIKLTTGEEVFVHLNDVEDRVALNANDEVEFQIEVSPKGAKAKHCRKIGFVHQGIPQ